MPQPPLRWDLFCRVIDNHGDAGVCWRLAADLAARGHAVRLVIDDASPLAWMAPSGAAGVVVQPWPGETAAPVGDVVIEAFGCDPPPAFVDTMAARPTPPVWVNLEYLSAEDWVERAHGLPSPQPCGITKWFLFPGFTPRTAGLLREPGLLARRARFDGRAWLAARGWAARPGERVVLLFSYANTCLEPLRDELAQAPTLLLVPPGPAQATAAAWAPRPNLRVLPLPYVSQVDFDHLLWSADLNFVRGEDSLVRALWAGAPFVWQAYPQDDGVHLEKLAALLARLGAAPAVAALWQAWNGAPGATWPGLPPAAAWQPALARFSSQLQAQADLAGTLEAFAERQAAGSCA